MSTLLDTRPPTLFGGGEDRRATGRARESGAATGGIARAATGSRQTSVGEQTLDRLIASAWEGLAARARVRCPACDAEMRPAYSPEARLLGGRCTDCGATLT